MFGRPVRVLWAKLVWRCRRPGLPKNRHDAIIATNTGRFVGGTHSPGHYDGKQIDLHAIPWRLFVGKPLSGPVGE